MNYGIEDVEKVLHTAPYPWFIAGGCGLDLFIGRQTRKHSDVDIVVFRKDADAVFSSLSDYDLQTVTGPGQLLPRSKADDLIENRHSVWVKDNKTEDYLFELLFNDSDETNWIYRRNKRVVLPLSRMGTKIGKWNVLAPEIILLYKSKNLRGVDEEDFKNILPVLSSEAKGWLKNAIQLDYLTHPWCAVL